MYARLTDLEGQRLQRIVRRGSTSSVRYRRAMMLLASAGGNRVPVIAYLRWRDASARHRDVLAAERRERARVRSEKASAGEADRFRQLLDQTGTSNTVSRPSSSSHCSPTSTKPNPEIVARDAALSGLTVTRTVLTPASATDRRTNSVSIALA